MGQNRVALFRGANRPIYHYYHYYHYYHVNVVCPHNTSMKTTLNSFFPILHSSILVVAALLFVAREISTSQRLVLDFSVSNTSYNKEPVLHFHVLDVLSVVEKYHTIEGLQVTILTTCPQNFRPKQKCCLHKIMSFPGVSPSYK